MTLVKWTPKPMSLFDEMDNMVSSVFGNDWNFPAKHTDWAPAVDVKETDDLFFITADIPGLTKKVLEPRLFKLSKLFPELDGPTTSFPLGCLLR